jgi:FAD/FMN-containing dehydrogenase
MVKRAIEMEGTATGEHGVGMVKRDYLEHEVGRSTFRQTMTLNRGSAVLVSSHG